MRKQLRLNKQRRTRKFRVSNAVKKVSSRPRMCVFRSSRHISVQVVDDLAAKTLASASTYEKDFRASNKTGGNVEAAAVIGKLIGERALAAGVTAVAFDRKGYKYHGRVKALADAARDAGLDIGAKGSEE
ncbi:MAG: 50S ribosomal protein L18 [Thermoguttaceae bacterium]|nr:50S ribosomal protein L18 [Thermoguttaceae bacterium]